MIEMFVLIGAVFGFFSIAFGAYAAHGLRTTITPEDYEIVLTALHYHQMHAAVMVTAGFQVIRAEMRFINLLVFACICWSLGVVLFSFAVYASVIFDLPEIRVLTPYGGMNFLLGWVLLLVFGARHWRHWRASSS